MSSSWKALTLISFSSFRMRSTPASARSEAATTACATSIDWKLSRPSTSAAAAAVGGWQVPMARSRLSGANSIGSLTQSRNPLLPVTAAASIIDSPRIGESFSNSSPAARA